MKTNKLLKVFAKSSLATLLVTTSFVFAEVPGVSGSAIGSVGTMPPPQPGMPGEQRPENRPPGFFQKMFNDVRGERKEIRQDAKTDIDQAKSDFKQGMQERKDWANASATAGTATPTPWKDLRGDMKDIKMEVKGDLKQMREDMRGKMASATASLTDSQLAEISARIGISVEVIKQQLASGIPLFEIVKDKIKREDIIKIVPPPATPTNATGTMQRPPREERGFFNNLRLRILGADTKQNTEIQTTTTVNPDGTVTTVNTETNVEVNATGTAPEPVRQLRNFFKRFFNF